MAIAAVKLLHNRAARSPASCYRCDAACGSSSESALSFSAAGCDQRRQSEPQQCDCPLCRTVRSPTVHSATGVLLFCCALAIAVLCCPPAVPSCQCVVVSVLLSSARCVCDLLPPARHNQIPTVKPLTVGLSRTKKFSNFFQSILARHVANSVPRPCAPCNPSARAYPAPWTTHGGGRTARARGGVVVPCKAI
jgi:hypothetical protein